MTMDQTKKVGALTPEDLAFLGVKPTGQVPPVRPTGALTPEDMAYLGVSAPGQPTQDTSAMSREQMKKAGMSQIDIDNAYVPHFGLNNEETQIAPKQYYPDLNSPESVSKYFLGAMKNLAKQGVKAVSGLADLPGKAVTAITDTDMSGAVPNLVKAGQGISRAATHPKQAGEEVINAILTAGKGMGNIAKGVLDDTIGTLRDAVADPKAFFYNRPLDAIDTVTTLTGGFLLGSKILEGAKLISGTTMTGKALKGIYEAVPQAFWDANKIDKVALISAIDDDWAVKVGRKFNRANAEKQLTIVRKQLAGTGSMPRFAKTFDEKQMFEDMGTNPKPWVGRVLSDTIHSPSEVLDRHPVGKMIYSTTDRADRQKRLFQTRFADKYEEAYRGVNYGTPLSSAIGKMAENGIEPMIVAHGNLRGVLSESIFTPEEIVAVKKNAGVAARAAQFQRDFYNSSIKEWANEIVGPDAAKSLMELADEARTQKASMSFISQQVGKLDADAKQVFDVFVRREQNYFPHMFDPQALKEQMIQKYEKMNGALAEMKAAYATPAGAEAAASTSGIPQSALDVLKAEGFDTSNMTSLSAGIEGLEKDLPRLQEAIGRVKAGDPILHDILPKNIKFGPFEPRKGAVGYQQDSRVAIEQYAAGLARKMYDEPALKKSAELYRILPEDMKEYTKWYLQRFAGAGNSGGANVIRSLKNFEWSRTLGLNPRSAINNAFQNINLFADAGFKDTYLGAKRAMSEAGRASFASTGLKQTAGLKFLEGEVATGKIGTALEKARNITGFMFRKVEEGNLAWGVGLGEAKGLARGLSPEKALEKGVELAEKAHFRYGRIGTSRAMTGIGGLAFQFAGSYPVKQFEFLSKIAKEDPMKLIRWLAISEGVKGSVEDVLNMDLSNALGVGINYGELITALRSATTEGDFRKSLLHLGGAFTGGGFMPQGFGPLVTSGIAVEKGWSEGGLGGAIKSAAGNVVPVAISRLMQGIKAISKAPKGDEPGAKEDAKYPIFSPATGSRLYNDTDKELLIRTFLATPSSEAKKSREASLRYRIDKYGDAIMRTMNDLSAKALIAMQSGDMKTVDANAAKIAKLSIQYKLSPSEAGVKSSLMREWQTKLERLPTPKSRIPFDQYMRGK